MTLFARIILVSALALGACAAEDATMSTDERADLVEVIAYHQPDAPTMIEMGGAAEAATTSHSIAFGHCDEAEVDEDGAIHVACNEKWSELVWLQIPKEASQALLEQGQTTLAFDVAITHATAERESVRFALHALSEEGSTKKVATRGNVLDGETVEAALEDTAYYIYMARGKNSSLIWHNGSLEVDLRVRSE